MFTRKTGMLAAGVAMLLGISIATGCGSASTSAGGTTTSSTAPSTTMAEHDAASMHKAELMKPSPVALHAKASKYGTVIFNQEGQVVYAFEKDAASTSNCSGACADFWPPVLTDGDPTATGDLDPSKVGTLTRADGSSQVTYNGRPLYYMDEPAGEIHCQNMKMHGGLWWVVDVNGDPVKSA